MRRWRRELEVTWAGTTRTGLGNARVKRHSYAEHPDVRCRASYTKALLFLACQDTAGAFSSIITPPVWYPPMRGLKRHLPGSCAAARELPLVASLVGRFHHIMRSRQPADYGFVTVLSHFLYPHRGYSLAVANPIARELQGPRLETSVPPPPHD